MPVTRTDFTKAWVARFNYQETEDTKLGYKSQHPVDEMSAVTHIV